MDKAKAPGTPTPEKTISKMEAVRRALARFGPETKPTEIANFIKKSFNIDLTNDRISNYKSEILRQHASKGKAAKETAPAAPMTMAKPAAMTKEPAPVAMTQPKPSASTNGTSGGGIGLKDIETVKDLLARVGQKQLEGLIELFAD